jgi:hypothetical protein
MQGDTGGKGGKIVKTRNQAKVMRLPCTVYEAYSFSGEKQLDMCVTDIGNLPDGKAVKKLMGSMSEFFKSIMSSMSFGQRGERGPFENINAVDGFPIKTVRYEGGQAVEVTTVTSMKKAEFKPEDFNPFPQYPTVDMMGGGAEMRKMRRQSRRPRPPEGMGADVPGDSMSPPPGYPIPGQTPGQPMDLQKLLEGLQQRR